MIRYGMTGTGRTAGLFYEANRYNRDFELTAIYSRSLDQAKEFAWHKGNIYCSDDLDQLAGSDEVDAVYIASPNSCHYDQTRLMLEHGKHVLCEKPLAASRKEAEELFSLARDKGLVLMEAMSLLYTKGFLAVKEQMKTLGKIRRATIICCEQSIDYASYRRGIIGEDFRAEPANGALMNMGSCGAAAMISLFGRPDLVRGLASRLHNGIDGQGTILFEYPDMIGEVLYSGITDSTSVSEIQGEEGSMLISQIHTIKNLRIKRKGVIQSLRFDQSDNIVRDQTDAFVRAIKTGIFPEEAEALSMEVHRVLDQVR